MLNAQPDSDVVLSIISSDTGEATVTSSLTFTSANWDTAQTVTVTGADDDLIDGTVSSTTTISINDASSDNNFDGVANQTVSVSRLMMMLPGSRLLKLKGQQVLPRLVELTRSLLYLTLNQTVTSFFP